MTYMTHAVLFINGDTNVCYYEIRTTIVATAFRQIEIKKNETIAVFDNFRISV